MRMSSRSMRRNFNRKEGILRHEKNLGRFRIPKRRRSSRIKNRRSGDTRKHPLHMKRRFIYIGRS